jgi:hypothetical protein
VVLPSAGVRETAERSHDKQEMADEVIACRFRGPSVLGADDRMVVAFHPHTGCEEKTIGIFLQCVCKKVRGRIKLMQCGWRL